MNSTLTIWSHSVFVVALTATSIAVAEVRHERVDDKLFLHCVDVAAELKLVFKVVQPHRLATFCGAGDNGICIPVRLTGTNHLGDGKNLRVTSDVLERALRFRSTDDGARVTLSRHARPLDAADDDVAPAYNAEWGKGRGFHKGQTLPDIPLIDLEGNEVRFSHFLGKRYILYAWASW